MFTFFFLQFIEIKAKTKQHMPTLSPHYIFEVIHSPENNMRFEQRCAGQDVLYGYHGSQIENFHSILNFGLQSHLSKVTVTTINDLAQTPY